MPEEISTTVESSPTPTKEKSFDWLKVILAIIIGFGLLAVSAYAGYWYGSESAKFKSQISKPQLKSQSEPTAQPTPPSPTPVVEDETKDWEVYRNEKYGFEIRYPSEVDCHFQEDALGKKSEFPRFYFVGEIDSPGLTIRKEENLERAEISQFIEERYQALLKESQEKSGPPPQKLTNPHYLNINGIKAYQGRRFAFDRYEVGHFPF